MAVDDLDKPLGYDPGAIPNPATPKRPIPWRMVGWSCALASVTAISTLAYVKDTGMGAEPFAIAKIEIAPPAPPSPQPADGANATQTAAAAIRPGVISRATGGEVEAESGVRVVRQGGGETPGALIIQVPEDFGVRLAPAPDRRLVEKGKYGSLPRIGADGAKPLDVYARPVITAANLKPGAPRIAIVIGGMGLSQQATQTASAKLPGAITLAFAPYGPELEKQVTRARDGGHEVILQIPMEPFDLAQSPGPHTLMASARPEQNIDDLQWLMSRFSGYVGVASFLGARFLSNDAAVAPILHETTSRGLLYFDDGSSPESSATAIAATSGAAFLRADVVLDLVQKPDAIQAELARLEKLARLKGFAVGTATGLPSTVDEIARFARGLEKRGIALAPLSSLASASAAIASAPAR